MHREGCPLRPGYAIQSPFGRGHVYSHSVISITSATPGPWEVGAEGLRTASPSGSGPRNKLLIRAWSGATHLDAKSMRHGHRRVADQRMFVAPVTPPFPEPLGAPTKHVPRGLAQSATADHMSCVPAHCPCAPVLAQMPTPLTYCCWL
jgi:hypothetical protein